MVRPLTPGEMSSDEFKHLLWLAVEVADDELARITRDELPALTVMGDVDEGVVIAFAAFSTAVDVVTIEYIAVDEGNQGRGLGGALVRAIRHATPDSAIQAETDDDAVEFYRRLGFVITPTGAPDPRWPDRQRYTCVLSQPRAVPE